MAELNFRFGVVASIKDPKKFVIKFTIEDWIENAVAYPLNVKDQPDVGDPIIVYIIENKFGYSFLYEKLKLKEFIRHKIFDQEVNLYEDKVLIKAGDNADITLYKDGKIDIKTGSSAEIKFDSNGTIDIKGGRITITGEYLATQKGNVPPTGQGGFCAVPVCPITGAPHVGTKIMSP